MNFQIKQHGKGLLVLNTPIDQSGRQIKTLSQSARQTKKDRQRERESANLPDYQ